MIILISVALIVIGLSLSGEKSFASKAIKKADNPTVSYGYAAVFAILPFVAIVGFTMKLWWGELSGERDGLGWAIVVCLLVAVFVALFSIMIYMSVPGVYFPKPNRRPDKDDPRRYLSDDDDIYNILKYEKGRNYKYGESKDEFIEPENGINILNGRLWNGQGNILTVGGSRGGKGVNIVLPALLSDVLKHPDAASFVVLDPKGENAAISVNHLKRCGYTVHVINPFNIPEIEKFGHSRINPFDAIDPNNPYIDKFIDMVRFAIVPPSSGDGKYFDESARNIIKLFIRYMLTQDEEPKTFRTLYRWLRLVEKDQSILLAKMSISPHFDGDISMEAKSLINQIIQNPKTANDVMATAIAYTDVFGDSQLRHTFSGADLSIADIPKEKTAIFLCLNPDDITRMQVWLKILFSSLMQSFPKTYNPNRKVVLLLDEFARIGQMDEFESMAYLPGYNIVMWFVIQDLNQLKKNFPQSWETFVGSTHIKHWVYLDDNFTAKYASERMPKIRQWEGSLRVTHLPHEFKKEGIIVAEIKGLEMPIQRKATPYWEQNNNGDPNPFRR